MWRRRKHRAWYTSALLALLIARVIYGFAKFFMKAAEKQGRRREVGVGEKKWWWKRKGK
jgi:hypothetical protein